MSLQPRGCTTKLFCPWDSPGKNTGVGCHALLQGISWPRDRTQVLSGLLYLAGGFFTKVPPYKLLISVTLGMSLVVQWLSLHLPVQGGVGSAPSWEAKISHASWPKNQNIILAKKSEDKNRSNIVAKSIKTFKMIHSKKKKLKNKTLFLV